MTMRFISGLASRLLLACTYAIGHWARVRKTNVARRRRQKRRGRRAIDVDQLMVKAGEGEPNQPSY